MSHTKCTEYASTGSACAILLKCAVVVKELRELNVLLDPSLKRKKEEREPMHAEDYGSVEEEGVESESERDGDESDGDNGVERDFFVCFRKSLFA